MRPALTWISLTVLVAMLAILSCQKEYSCENCRGVNRPPVANAGPDQSILLPQDSSFLDGSASKDPDGSIKQWQWRQITGSSNVSIATASSARTAIRKLAAGVYQFELTVTDDGGAASKDTVAVTVSSAAAVNRPPVARAGADQTIFLPTNTCTLNGSASSDPDNNITSYEWTKLSGPACNIVSSTLVQTKVDNLREGVYSFQLKVVDAGGLSSLDTVAITVKPDPAAICFNDRPKVYAQLVSFGHLSYYRTSVTPATAADKIVFAGGMDESGSGAALADKEDLYSMTTQDWSLSVQSPHLNCGVAVSGDEIYFAGGGYYYDVYFSAIDVYDAANNIWHHMAFKEPKTYVAGAAIGDKILFAGGFRNKGDDFPNNIEDKIEIYQPSTNTWSSVPLSEARGGITSATINNKVYFAGGWNTAPSNKIDIYDGATNTWAASTLQYLPTAKTAIAYGDNIYWNDGSCKVEARNVKTGASSLESLSMGGFVVSVVKDNKILFIHPGSLYFDIYDPSTRTWSIGVLPQAVPVDAAVISVNNTIYIAGGGIGENPMGNGAYAIIATNEVWKLQF